MDDEPNMTLADAVGALRAKLKILVVVPLLAGVLALGVAFLIPPTFTASVTFLPPQPAQGGGAAALASLGALAGLAGNASGVVTPGDRYVSLMRSTTVSDRIVEHFKLQEVYATKFRVEARDLLALHVRISLGRKDGLITLEVDDPEPQRAADIANRYIDELRRLTGTLAVTEAQQRRVFFEQHLQASRDRLARAQQALEASAFSSGALKAEPRAAAEAYAKLKAEATGAEIRLQLLRSSLADATPEIKQQMALLATLREQVARAERAGEVTAGASYVSRYREFKYEEALFEFYARQFELARADESREGALMQVVDPATAPEKRSAPKRAMIVKVTTVLTALFLIFAVLLRHALRIRTARRLAA